LESKTSIREKSLQATYTNEQNHPTPAEEKEKNVARTEAASHYWLSSIILADDVI
jgi:hypothetical protein